MPQSSSPEFDDAVNAPSFVITPHRVRAGWYGQDEPLSAPVEPVLYREDNFNRTVAGPLRDAFSRNTSNGWGTPDVGPAWTHISDNISDFYTVDSADQARMDIFGVTLAHWSISPVNYYNAVLEASVSTNTLAVGGSQMVNLVMRFIDVDNCYMARLELTTSQTVVLSFRKRKGGVGSTLATYSTSLTHQVGGMLRVRFRIFSDTQPTLSAKAWMDGLAEPADYQLTYVDSADPITSPGGIGVRASLAPGNTNPSPVTVSWSNLVTYEMGWGTSSDGRITYNWTLPTSHYSVEGNAGLMLLHTTGYTLRKRSTEAFRDVDLTYQVWTTVAITGTEAETGPTFRIDPADVQGRWYRMSFAFFANGDVGLRWLKRSSAGLFIMYNDQAEEGWVIVPRVTHAPNQKLWVRAQAAGNFLRGKAWADGDNEPPDWHITVEDKVDPHNFQGYWGIGAIAWSGNTNTKPLTFYFDNLRAMDLRVLDDLTAVMGGSYSVSHGMDDGMPDAVTSTSGGNEAVGTVGASLIGTSVGGVRMDARQLFSPWNDDSPYYGLPRDTARLELDQGVMTTNGEELVRLFTGQMANILIRGRDAELLGISHTRLLLSKAVKPPVVDGPEMGANATWLMSYLLWACGINIAPRPDDRGLQFYAPMHGSARPFIPYANGSVDYQARIFTGPGVFDHTRPTFIDGPYLMGVQATRSSDVGSDFGYGSILTQRMAREDKLGTPWLVQTESKGRVEFWIKGVTNDLGTDWAAQFRIWGGVGGADHVFMYMGVDSDRQLAFLIEDGSGTAGGGDDRLFTAGLIVPQDNEWHACGFYWDWASNELRVRLDGDEKIITPGPALTTVHLPEWDNYTDDKPQFWVKVPVSDIQFYSGKYSDPVDYGWNDRLERIDGDALEIEDFEDTTYVTTMTGVWARSNTRAYTGTWSMKASAIGHNATSDMDVTLPPGTESIDFRYWVSSEENFDFFEVYADGTNLLFDDSGVPGVWRWVSLPLPEGTTSVRFRYSKDAATVSGEDSVWIDELVFRGAPLIIQAWAPDAIMRPVDVELEAIAQTTAREAWGWLAELCQSCMTAMRTDEADRLMILPPSYFVEPEQLANVDVISTDWNAKDPDITIDPSKIRNSVQVDFNETRVDTSWTFLLSMKTSTPIPRGKSTQTFTLDVPAVFIDQDYMTIETDNTPLVAVSSKLWANTKADGSGTYLSSGTFSARILAWDAGRVTVEFDNRHTGIAYLAHNYLDDLPYFAIAGKGAYSTQAATSFQDTQQLREERTVTVQAGALQRREDARRLAVNLLFWTTHPRAEVKINVMGDPRRQPGDLTSLVDAEGTQIGGSWRTLVVEHNRSGGEFTQTLHLRESPDVALWDTEALGWDEGVWDL